MAPHSRAGLMMDDLAFLDLLHAVLRPRAYLEIGGEIGSSLTLSRTRSIAVAPDALPGLQDVFGGPWLKLYRETSDEFFRDHTAEATLEGYPLDLAVIDGVHALPQVIGDLAQIERWGHAETVVVVRAALPGNERPGRHTTHDGVVAGDHWRIVLFLRQHRPDLTCWLIDGTGALIVTGLDSKHAGMANLAETFDRDEPPHDSAGDRLVGQRLRTAETVSPQTVLRALRPLPRVVGHHVRGEGWIEGPAGWVATAEQTAGQIHITPDEPIRGSHGARLTLTAHGLPVLRIQIHYAGGNESPTGNRYRVVFLDVTQPGALVHGLDSLWLNADSRHRSFELDWEALLAPDESLTHITLDPVDYDLSSIATSPEMRIAVERAELRQVAWPRSGTRFAPEHFPGRQPPKRNAGRRDAVIFAWWLPPTPEGHKLGEYYLGLLRYYHADSRIFVGINHGSDPVWRDRLAGSGLDVEIVAVDPAIQINSDVGGFLAALESFSRSPEPFDLVWFGHTKGASQKHFDDYLHFRHQHDRKFWSRRAEIERFFTDPKFGIFSHRYALHDPSPDVPWRGFADLESLQRVYRGTHAPLGLWAWETVFVMRHDIIRAFCATVGDEFFRLDPGEYGAGRWWFEAAFPSIASMQGFEPYIELDTDGPGSSHNDLVLYDDPRQTNRLAMEELQRWRDDPFTFAPRALPRGYLRDPLVVSDAAV